MKEILLTSSVLILALLLLRRLFQTKISRRFQYALWGLVLLRLLIPVNLPAISKNVLTAAEPVMQNMESLYVTPAQDTLSRPDQMFIVEAVDAPRVTVGPATENNVQISLDRFDVIHQTTYEHQINLADLLRPVWYGGIAVMACWLLLSNLLFWQKLRKVRTPYPAEACKYPVYLVESGLPSPCLFGLFRPAVYVTPETAADPAMLRHVLAHEYTHYKHGDHIWSLLRCAALAVHWWNPLVWLAAGLSRRDAELACDEGAIKRLGDGERAAYGGTLLSLVTAKPGPSDLFRCATTMAGDKKRLKERITCIAQAPKRWLWAAVAVVLVTALACLCAFGQGPQETEQDPVHTEGPSAQPAEEQWTDIPELLAKFPVNAADAPEDVVHFVGQVVQERYTTYLDYLRENPVSDEPIQFDGWRVDGLNGPWRGTVRDMELEVWSINYLFHTTTPKEAENLIVGGNYLTEDGWLCPTYPNCTYVIFQVNGAGELNFLTAEMINDCSPDGASGMFFETVAAALGRKGLADFHSGPDLGGVPEDVAQAAKGRVQAAYNNWRGDTSLKGTPQFDDWRIYDLTGPWEEATETARFEVWRLGYEIHTTTPDRVKVMDGMSLHPDGWFRLAQPDSLYLLFNVKDGGRTYLTDISSTDCGPGDPEFHDLLERLGGRLVVPENLPETDLNRNGVPETPRLALIDGGTGQRLELWEEGKLIFSEEGYFAHAGYNALFLYHGDDGDYLLRYHPYMGQGTASYTFELFTLSPTGEEVTAREGYVEFDINFQSPAHERFNPRGIAEFMGEVNGMLADSVQLLNTDVDLLDTFRKEGRLYDSLGWLDGWEPVFDRDESRSLEDNLRAFQAAMEEQRENERADWGLALTASSATPTGLTLTFTQSGGQPTGNLQYGSKYWLERKDGEGWTRRSDILEPSVNLAWTDEAYMIPIGGQTSQEVDWSWLYGQLLPGRYRIGKEVTDFRKTGDYDTQDYYAEFEVK